MSAYLFQLIGDEKRKHEFNTDNFTIGRRSDNDLQINDSTISRHHCRIEQENDAFIIHDLDSHNGTIVNHQAVNSCEIKDGDQILLGDTVLVFSKTGEPPRESDVKDYSDSSNTQTEVQKVEALPESFRVEHNISDSEVFTEDFTKAQQQSQDQSGEQEQEDNEGKPDKFALLYRLGKALSSEIERERVLKTTMESIISVYEPSRCAIMITPPGSDVLEPRLCWTRDKGFIEGEEISVNPSLAKQCITEKASILSSNLPEDPRFDSGRTVSDLNKMSVMCAPLWDKHDAFGVIWVDRKDDEHAFDREDLNLLTAISNQLALRIKQDQTFEALKEEAVLRKNLERFHSPDVVQEITRESKKGKEISREIEESRATILFVDIERFANLAENLSPRRVTEILNHFYDLVCRTVFENDGGINKYIGDKVMATFGAPVKSDNQENLAVQAGRDLLDGIQHLNNRFPEPIELKVRIGINTGNVVHGYIGSSQVKEFTVIGDAVNVAARLEEIAYPNDILIGKQTSEALSDDVNRKAIGSIHVAGRQQRVDVFRVITPNIATEHSS